jgi:C-terminal processing protease CtpA/Prc
MYRRDWPQWTDAERQAIDAAMTTFNPQWLPPARDEDFSDWHYLVISRSPDAATRSGELYHYDRPVIVLMDGGCFSATDIFLGAFKGLANVTLMGTPSSGGSGRKQSIRLPASGLNIALSSMISYRPDGSLYDLRGIEPDVLAPPIATDFLVGLAATDSQLQAAIDRLRGDAR